MTYLCPNFQLSCDSKTLTPTYSFAHCTCPCIWWYLTAFQQRSSPLFQTILQKWAVYSFHSDLSYLQYDDIIFLQVPYISIFGFTANNGEVNEVLWLRCTPCIIPPILDIHNSTSSTNIVVQSCVDFRSAHSLYLIAKGIVFIRTS